MILLLSLIIKTSNNREDMSNYLTIRIDNRLYSKDAIIAVLYELSNKYDVTQEIDKNDTNFIIVNLSSNTKVTESLSQLERFFWQKLIDQQLRIHINQQFGHIRDLIVEEAFKPISK